LWSGLVLRRQTAPPDSDWKLFLTKEIVVGYGRVLMVGAALVAAAASCAAQAGYFLAGTQTLPDINLTQSTVNLTVASNRQDVKAIGQGRTQLANGLNYNAMLDNPALLSESRGSFDLPSVMASIPEQ
jgi:hypothetical protein